MSTVTERLGNVLYWTANVFAVLCIIAGTAAAVMVYVNHRDVTTGITIVLLSTALLAIVSYLFGRACRYVLVGK